MVLLVCCICATCLRPRAAAAADSPIGAHSMLQLNAPFSFMQSMFAEAASMHASKIRLDVQPSMVFTNPSHPPDFSGLDEVMALSQQYHLPVVADLLSIPWWIADCQGQGIWPTMMRCGTNNLAAYRTMIGQIVTHATPVIRDWEIWNEPDSRGFFSGTPQQYAQMLRAAHDTIKQIDPGASVLLGGMSGTGGMTWLAQVFGVRGPDAAHAFDVANVHERARLGGLDPNIGAWKQFLGRYGFAGPLWVTEHGYPSDSAYQYDPAYAGGPASQAAFLRASIPTLVDAGASEVFVTERDNLGGQFGSEGLLGGDVLDPPSADPVVVEKPSYGAVAGLSACYVSLGRDCAGPAPEASPASLVVPATPLYSSSLFNVVVSNPGAEPIRLGQVSLGAVSAPMVELNAPAPALAIDSETCSRQLLEPGQRCTATMRFTPTAPGPVTASLEVPSDNGTLAVPVSAGVSSVSGLSSVATSFLPTGSINRVGQIQRIVLAVTNPLSVPVHIAGSALSMPPRRPFTMAANGCRDVTLGAGATCRLSIVFTPERRGAAEATLTLSGDGLPLQVALRAGALTAPMITRVWGFPNRIVVMTDEPATIYWKLVPRLRRGLGAHIVARGRTASTRPRPGGRSIARFALPARLRRGTYLLTVRPSGAHGTGRPQTMWLTVAG